MTDSFHRQIDYLRISITDSCNFRCVYCMPEKGQLFLKESDILSLDEIIRTVRIMADIGIRHVRVTGGEPSVRRGYKELLKALKEIPGIETVAITTNGSRIPEDIDELVSLGLDGINISLDSLKEDRYNRLTRTEGNLPKVMDAIDLAEKSPINTKINCVAMAGINNDEIADIAGLAKDRDLSVRFIEYMPIGKKDTIKPVPEDRILEELEKSYGFLLPVDNIRGNGPAVYFKPENFKGVVGIIGAITHKFCDRCNRIRLTSDGFLKLCLQYDTGISVSELLRSGCSDEFIKEKIEKAVMKKPEAHVFTDFRDKENVDGRGMSAIGG